jgi:hypothetical protein
MARRAMHSVVMFVFSATLLVPLATPAEAHFNCTLRAPLTAFPGPVLYGYAALENCDRPHYKYWGKALLQRRINGSWQGVVRVTDSYCCNTYFGPDDLDFRSGCPMDGITDRFRILVEDIYTISSTGNKAHRYQTWIGPVLAVDCAGDGRLP